MGLTRLPIVSLVKDFVQHARRWRLYRAIAFETNFEEYPFEGISIPGRSNLWCEKDIWSLFKEVCERKLVLFQKSKSEG